MDRNTRENDKDDLFFDEKTLEQHINSLKESENDSYLDSQRLEEVLFKENDFDSLTMDSFPKDQTVARFSDDPEFAQLPPRGSKSRSIKKDEPMIGSPRQSQQNNNKPKKAKPVVRVLTVLFYVIMIATVVLVFLFSNQNKGYKSIGGYSFFSVLTGSMESVIPQGSLAIVKKIDVSKIKVGDNITFVIQGGETKTHQVVGILDDYNNSGQRGFRTKGTENELADKEIVYAGNVIGIVIKHVPRVGKAFTYVRDNLWILVALLLSFFIATFSVKRYYRLHANEKTSNNDNQQEEHALDDQSFIEGEYR